jgi:hypothetical protein
MATVVCCCWGRRVSNRFHVHNISVVLMLIKVQTFLLLSIHHPWVNWQRNPRFGEKDIVTSNLIVCPMVMGNGL